MFTSSPGQAAGAILERRWFILAKKDSSQLDRAKKDSAVKKINQRYIEICREFGPNSGIARDYYNTMELVAGSENIRIVASTTSKKAPRNNPDYITDEIKVGQIRRDKNTLDSIDWDDLEALLNKHTAGEVKKSAQEEAKRQSEDTGDDISMFDVIEDMDAVYDFLDENGYDSKDSDATSSVFAFYWDAVGPGAPRPTYTELRRIIEMQQKQQEMIEIGDAEAANNIENKLFKRLKATHERDVFGGL